MLTKAFILCGGKGTRLRPLTYETQKVMIPVNGRPILEYNIELMRKHGIKTIVLGVGYLSEQIKKHFGSKWNGTEIVYSQEKGELGTGGALKLASKNFDSTFAMCNGDEIKNIDITKMFEHHRKNKALATLALVEVEDTSQFGVVELDGERIINFVEKPKPEDAPSNFANAGLYILEREVLDLLPDGKSSIEKDLFPKLAQLGKLYGFKFEDTWLTTDTHERLDKTKSALEK